MAKNMLSREKIIPLYAGKPVSELSYATVRDFCDSADHLSPIMRFDGDLKDVQRAWMVKAILGQVPLGGRLLEIGGGEPLASNALQELGYDVTLIDPYDGSGNGPQLYDHFRRLYPRVKIVKAYFEKDNLMLAGKQYECIFSISVLEHVPHDKLSDLFIGIDHYLRKGGKSIHCIDHIVTGFGDEFSAKGLIEMLCGQKRIQNPAMAEEEICQYAEKIYQLIMSQMSDDIETYYHSALGHNLWRTGLGLSYDKFPFRKIVSIQTCVGKS